MQNLHDGVGLQLITSLMLVKGGTATQQDMINLLQDCIDEMRMALDASSTEDDDLLPMLGTFRARITPRFNAIGLRLVWLNKNLPEKIAISPQGNLQVLRILQEALTNIARHARGAETNIAVILAADGHLIVEISDRGPGFDVERALAKRDSLGLAGLVERVHLSGGRIEIFSKAGQGTRIHAEFPLPATEALPT